MEGDSSSFFFGKSLAKVLLHSFFPCKSPALPTASVRFLLQNRTWLTQWPTFTLLTRKEGIQIVHHIGVICRKDFSAMFLWRASRHNSCSSVLQSFRLFNKSCSCPRWNISKIYDWDGQETVSGEQKAKFDKKGSTSSRDLNRTGCHKKTGNLNRSEIIGVLG